MWEKRMYALFAFAVPLLALEFLRPGLVTAYVPLTIFAAPFLLIIPAAFEKEL